MLSRKAIVTLALVLSGLIALEFPSERFEAAAPVVAQTVDQRKAEADRLLQQGIQQYQTSQYEAALQSWQQALAIYQAIKDRSGEADALGNLGVAYSSLLQYNKAIEFYQKALAIAGEIGDRMREGVSLQNIAETYRSLKQYPQALQVYQQALSIAESVNDRENQATILNNMGVIYKNQGRYEKALQLYKQALDIGRRLEDRLGEALNLNNIGEIYRNQGQYSQAIQSYNEGLEILQKSRLTSVSLSARGARFLDQIPSGLTRAEAERTHFSLNRPHHREPSDSTQAELVARIRREVISQPHRPSFLKTQAQLYERSDKLEAAILHNFGVVYDQLGQPSKALETYERALAIRRKTQDKIGEGETLNNIGLIYETLHQNLKALEFYQQSLVVRKATRDRSGEATTLNNIALLQNKLGQPEQGLKLLRQALLIFQELGDEANEGNTLDSLGTIYKKLGRYSEAYQSYQQALNLLQKVGSQPIEQVTFSNIGSLLEKQNQPELAIIFYKRSVNVIETIRADIRNLPRDSQEAYTQSVAYTYRALADLLLQQDRILEAQQVLDLLKLQEFSDSLKDTRSTPQPIAFRKAERELLEKFNQQQQGAIAAAQDLKTLLDRPENQRSPQDRDRIRQLQQLQEQIAANFLQFIASAEVQTLTDQLRRKDSGSLDPEFLNQLQNKLGNQLAKLPHTALFYPLILDDRLELILVTPDSAPIRRTVPIKREDLNRAISNFSRALKDSSQDAKPSAQALYNILIQPIAEDLTKANIATLLYSPDRRLRYVPLPALHDGNQWLLERLTINYITVASVTDLTTPRQPQPQVLAGAISDNRQQQYTVNLPQTPQRQFLGLPNVSQELNGITAQLPTTRTLRDRAFTVDAIKSLSRQYNILHFATHGSFERDRPELSFILFGDTSSDGKNYATLQDIGTWKLDADLVILSACETGLADDQFTTKADDSVAVMGLGYRFEQAGARATIASLWTVNDASTSTLMQQFYANLSGGKTTKSEALRQAQLALLNNKVQPKTKGDRTVVQPETPNQPTRNDRVSSEYSHPYYWAPFILIGNGL